jgi:hypothetical protein
VAAGLALLPSRLLATFGADVDDFVELAFLRLVAVPLLPVDFVADFVATFTGLRWETFFETAFLTVFFAAVFFTVAFLAAAAFVGFLTTFFLVEAFFTAGAFTLFFALPVRLPEAPVRLPADFAVFFVVFFFGLNVIAWSN